MAIGLHAEKQLHTSLINMCLHGLERIKIQILQPQPRSQLQDLSHGCGAKRIPQPSLHLLDLELALVRNNDQPLWCLIAIQLSKSAVVALAHGEVSLMSTPFVDHV